MFAAGALGNNGRLRTFTMLKRQIQQLIEQIAREKVSDAQNHLISK